MVKQGILSPYDSTCETDGVYRTGDTIQEPAGTDYVHIGRDLGDTPLVLVVLYVLPHGSPFSEGGHGLVGGRPPVVVGVMPPPRRGVPCLAAPAGRVPGGSLARATAAARRACHVHHSVRVRVGGPGGGE